jgi:hypothetical protein
MKNIKAILIFLFTLNTVSCFSQCLPNKENVDTDFENYLKNHFRIERSETINLNPVFDSVITFLKSNNNKAKIVFSKVRDYPDWNEYYIIKCEENTEINQVISLLKSFDIVLKSIEFTENEKRFKQKETFSDGSTYNTEYYYKIEKNSENRIIYIRYEVSSIGPSGHIIEIRQKDNKEICLEIDYWGT